MDHRRQISTLLAWCALNGLEIDSRLKLDWDPKTGIAVYSKGSIIPLNTKCEHLVPPLAPARRFTVLSSGSHTKTCCIVDQKLYSI
ncbi:hypothetical protein M378DRAFT_918024 [Amanita muscaria Koide BX008]|uniref:Uncharacterized protein n=1 Tax=Amanita muscaria (strain Koide BX008) TaxID=946122 RepID=A0A0C2WGB4_AMAMK|nr:hypothetical protein M378DRAFT_918024 [Amanita muscaria Koide BX008]